MSLHERPCQWLCRIFSAFVVFRYLPLFVLIIFSSCYRRFLFILSATELQRSSQPANLRPQLIVNHRKGSCLLLATLNTTTCPSAMIAGCFSRYSSLGILNAATETPQFSTQRPQYRMAKPKHRCSPRTKQTFHCSSYLLSFVY